MGCDRYPRLIRALILAATVVLGLHCSGGGGGGGSCITFGASGAPGPSDMVATQGSASTCNVVEVALVLTDVNDVFAVSFVADFDPALATYEGFSLSGSQMGTAAQVSVQESTAAGQVSLGITRLNPNGGVNFAGQGTVIKLRFSDAPGASMGQGALSFSDTHVLGSETPPQEKNGIQWFGGALVIQ